MQSLLLTKNSFSQPLRTCPDSGRCLDHFCTNEHTVAGKILGNRIFVGIGLISYSAYMWHQPLLAFYKSKFFGQANHASMLAIAGLTFLLSYFSWKFIETPFRNKSRYSRKFILISVVLGTVFFAGVGLAGHFTNGFSSRAMALPFKPFEYDTDKLGYKKCDDPILLAGEPINYCYQTASGKVNAVLIGDSHADDKFYGIEKNSNELKWVLVGNSSCPLCLMST